MPARESQLKEPPYPKSKNFDTKKGENLFIEADDKDPVWLKDKGDLFFKRSDYHAAINAYTKALKADKDFLSGRLNRATCYIKTRNFNLCVDDINDIVSQIRSLKPDEREQDKDFYDKIMARSLVKRGAAHAWLSQFDEALKDFMTVIKDPIYCEIIGEQDVASLARDIKVIQDRQASSRIKQEGDWEFYKERLDEAMTKYEEALTEDKENEYAISNIGLIHLKKREYEKCIDMSTKALAILENFQSETKSFQQNNALEVKILLRRAKCFESLNEMEKAKADLDKLLLLEPQNSEARSMLKVVQVKLDDVTFNMYREQANEHLRNKQF